MSIKNRTDTPGLCTKSHLIPGKQTLKSYLGSPEKMSEFFLEVWRAWEAPKLMENRSSTSLIYFL